MTSEQRTTPTRSLLTEDNFSITSSILDRHSSSESAIKHVSLDRHSSSESAVLKHMSGDSIPTISSLGTGVASAETMNQESQAGGVPADAPCNPTSNIRHGMIEAIDEIQVPMATSHHSRPGLTRGLTGSTFDSTTVLQEENRVRASVMTNQVPTVAAIGPREAGNQEFQAGVPMAMINHQQLPPFFFHNTVNPTGAAPQVGAAPRAITTNQSPSAFGSGSVVTAISQREAICQMNEGRVPVATGNQSLPTFSYSSIGSDIGQTEESEHQEGVPVAAPNQSLPTFSLDSIATAIGHLEAGNQEGRAGVADSETFGRDWIDTAVEQTGNRRQAATSTYQRITNDITNVSPRGEPEYVLENEVRPLDILGGRGAKVNNHHGNQKFHKLVDEHKAEYKSIPHKSKPLKGAVSNRIVNAVHGYGGRFLKLETKGLYSVMGSREAKRKTSQALREDSYEWYPESES